MGLDSYGIDLSQTAIDFALHWARKSGIPSPDEKIVQGDVLSLPWRSEEFNFALSHGVLDSMPFDMARSACQELARVLKTNGLFYCDLVSGDDYQHAREYSGEEVVVTNHEKGTIQSYFNFSKISELIKGIFEIVECLLIRRQDILTGSSTSRYHLVLKAIK